MSMQPKAAGPCFPYPGHRTMAQVMADEAQAERERTCSACGVAVWRDCARQCRESYQSCGLRREAA